MALIDKAVDLPRKIWVDADLARFGFEDLAFRVQQRCLDLQLRIGKPFLEAMLLQGF